MSPPQQVMIKLSSLYSTKDSYQLGIDQRLASIMHPQINGLAKVSNWMILQGLKKRLNNAKGNWIKNNRAYCGLTEPPRGKIQESHYSAYTLA